MECDSRQPKRPAVDDPKSCHSARRVAYARLFPLCLRRFPVVSPYARKQGLRFLGIAARLVGRNGYPGLLSPVADRNHGRPTWIAAVTITRMHSLCDRKLQTQ